MRGSSSKGLIKVTVLTARGFKSWLGVMRFPFLSLSFVVWLYGVGLSYYYMGEFELVSSLLALAGLVSLHISVNLLNEYYDYITGLDFKTVKTPFSGGSGLLPRGVISARSTYIVGIFFFATGAIIGLYFLLSKGWGLFPILAIGAICVLFYTNLLARMGLGELAAGLGLGSLPVLGIFWVNAGYYSFDAVFASFPAGLLTAILLLLNEFPDFKPDKETGRKNLLMILGVDSAFRVYRYVGYIVYIWIGLCVVMDFLPLSCIIAFFSLPLFLRAVESARGNLHEPRELTLSLSFNVKFILTTYLLLAIGCIIGRGI